MFAMPDKGLGMTNKDKIIPEEGNGHAMLTRAAGSQPSISATLNSSLDTALESRTVTCPTSIRPTSTSNQANATATSSENHVGITVIDDSRNTQQREVSAARADATKTSSQGMIERQGQRTARSTQASSTNANQSAPEQNRAARVSLQAYLVRQQFLAGIRPENMISLTGRRQGQPPNRNQNVNDHPRTPPLVRITNDGVVVPQIPPAQFKGVMHPLPRGVIEGSTPDTAAFEHAERDSVAMGDGNIEMADASAMTANQRVVQKNCAPKTEDQTHGYPNKSVEIPTERMQPAVDVSDMNHQANKNEEARPADNVLRLFAEVATAHRGYLPASNNAPAAAEGEMTKTQFDLIKALVSYPELAMLTIDNLGIDGTITLYSVSKDFHQFVDSNLLAVVAHVAAKSALVAARIFPWQCYSKLCVKYPVLGSQVRATAEDAKNGNFAPSLRWLRMLSYRETVVEDIMTVMQQHGAQFPRGTEVALKKLWFLMDIPDNTRRIWIIQNRNVWLDKDIFFASHFLMNVDQYLTTEGPVGVRFGEPLRRLLMAQTSMSELWRTCRASALQTDFEVLKSYIRWRHEVRDGDADTAVVGVPSGEIGRLQYEGYGKTGSLVRLQRPDELILREVQRRELDMQHLYAGTFLHPQSGRRVIEDLRRQVPLMKEVQEASRKAGLNWVDVAVLDSVFE